MHEVIAAPATGCISGAIEKSDGQHSHMEILVMYAWACATVVVIFRMMGIATEEEAAEYYRNEESFFIFHKLGLSELFGRLGEENEEGESAKTYYSHLCGHFWEVMEIAMDYVYEYYSQANEGDGNLTPRIGPTVEFFRKDYLEIIPEDQAQIGTTNVALFTMALVHETVDAAIEQAKILAKSKSRYWGWPGPK